MPKEFSSCSVCGQTIREALTAIIVSEEGQAAHFDCVVRKLSTDEELRARERISYLGAGEFGIVRIHPSDHRKFDIRKRIKFETKEHNPAWRKSIAEGLSRLA